MNPNIRTRVHIPGALIGALLGGLLILLLNAIFGDLDKAAVSVALAYFMGNMAALGAAWSNRDKA